MAFYFRLDAKSLMGVKAGGAFVRHIVAMNATKITLDLREEIRTGCQPFSRIMNAAAGLQPGDQLFLLVPFEPVPLFQVLGRQGFRHEAKRTAAGDWEVLFTRHAECAPPVPENEPVIHRDRPPAQSVLEVDARGLEPPQPMVKILESLAALPAQAGLRARTDRRPIHLYSQLEQRGFVGQTEEESDGSFVTLIVRR